MYRLAHEIKSVKVCAEERRSAYQFSAIMAGFSLASSVLWPFEFVRHVPRDLYSALAQRLRPSTYATFTSRCRSENGSHLTTNANGRDSAKWPRPQNDSEVREILTYQ